MKILAINSWSGSDLKKHKPIDFWRIHGPLEELKKHVDWQIDYLPNFLPGADEFTSPEDFDEAAVEKTVKELGAYDVIISSYQPSPFVFALLNTVKKHYGTKYILDTDDDVYNIEPDSFFWLNNSRDNARHLQRMIELADYVCVPTEQLKKSFQYYRPGKRAPFVIPNYISDAYQNDKPKDGETVNIGYFGGAGHYYDLQETQIVPALEKLMHTYKNVHFTTVGILLDQYLPKARTHHIEAGDTHTWLEAIYPSLNFDIVIAPLRRTLFNEGKSNIKWQEATRMGAAMVASEIGPYRDIEASSISLVNNTAEDWFVRLERLLDPVKRAKQVLDARYELETKWKMENNWMKYKELFEGVHNVEP